MDIDDAGREDADREDERREAGALAALRPLLTAEFLATLRRAVTTYGWDGDLIEVALFADWCAEKAGLGGWPGGEPPLRDAI